MSHNGFLTALGGGSAAEAVAQREDDFQRWADDGGPSPDSNPARKATLPEPALRAWPPTRSIYRRRAGGRAALATAGPC